MAPLRVPESVRRIVNEGTAEEGFLAASQLASPVALGMVTQPPYSGGPLLGFEVVEEGFDYATLSVFACHYFSANGVLTTAYFRARELKDLQCTALTPRFATTLKLIKSQGAPAVAAVDADAYELTSTY